jgi:hypothetical protein
VTRDFPLLAPVRRSRLNSARFTFTSVAARDGARVTLARGKRAFSVGGVGPGHRSASPIYLFVCWARELPRSGFRVVTLSLCWLTPLGAVIAARCEMEDAHGCEFENVRA